MSVYFRMRVVLHHQISASDVQYALSCFKAMLTTNQVTSSCSMDPTCIVLFPLPGIYFMQKARR